ncbi:MAG TPA: hypothetical protein VIQ30_21955 [Pseudonocardia sp.]
MAIDVRDARQGGTGGTNTALNHSVAIPTCVVGDDLYASFTLNGGFVSVTSEPAGWTRIFPASITDDGFNALLIYRKTATSTEVAGGTIALTVGTACRANYGSISILGSDTSLAPDGVVTTTVTTAATSLSHTITASTNNSLILSILGLDSASENATPSAPLTQRWDAVEAGTLGQANVGATCVQAASGSATYTWTWTSSIARKGWTASIRAGGTDLVPDAASQAQTSDNVTLTQTHVLAPDPAIQAQTSDNVTLTQTHVLTVNPAAQAQTSDNVTLSQVIVLTVANAVQAQTSDNVVVTPGVIVRGSMTHAARNAAALTATARAAATIQPGARTGATMTGG